MVYSVVIISSEVINPDNLQGATHKIQTMWIIAQDLEHFENFEKYQTFDNLEILKT